MKAFGHTDQFAASESLVLNLDAIGNMEGRITFARDRYSEYRKNCELQKKLRIYKR